MMQDQWKIVDLKIENIEEKSSLNAEEKRLIEEDLQHINLEIEQQFLKFKVETESNWINKFNDWVDQRIKNSKDQMLKLVTQNFQFELIELQKQIA